MQRTANAVCLVIFAGLCAGAWAQDLGSQKDKAKVGALKATRNSTADGERSKTNISETGPNFRPDLASQYRIGEQDVLVITVWREPDLSATVMVRPDGKITLPLVNDVTASGLTTDELKSFLIEKLQPFVNVPQVTVAVREINSRKVFVIGQVTREGSYRINSSSTVLQIIAEAGGLRDFANRKGIYVLRQQNGKQVRMGFDYNKVVRGKDDNIQLRPGDTIVVP
jgi:polysaccharide export outer membrane protein